MLLCLEFQLSSNLVNLSYNTGRGTELMDGGVMGDCSVTNSHGMLTHLQSQPIEFHQNWCSTNWSSTNWKSSQFYKLPISKYCPIETYLVEIVKFGWNCEVWLKLCNLVEIVKFGRNYEIWWKLWNLVGIVKFSGKCVIWWKLWNLVEIVKIGGNC